jgi:hypothetical protein
LATDDEEDDMKRAKMLSGFMLSCGVAVAATAPPALAARLCVGHRPGCRPTIQSAVDAASDGDTVALDPGIYAGGATIDVSVRLAGAGAGRTVIAGGGPVLTIGTFGAAVEPTVAISGVTITGGVTRSSTLSAFFFDGDPDLIALGGGLEVPPAHDMTTGATLTVSDTVIVGNRVAPREARPIGPPCPSGPCPFAAAEGGGIDNWGTTTLARTVVAGNAVGAASGLSALASDAYAGAIMNERTGSLTLSSAHLRDNHASATAPNGRFADGGAIFSEGGVLDIRDSSVTSNSAELHAALPSSVDLLAIAGGIHSNDTTSATITGTTIVGNAVRATNSVGDATAFSGGFHADADVLMRDTTVSRNTVTVATTPGSSGTAHGDSGAGELSGTISGVRLLGNSVSVLAGAGPAQAIAGSVIFGGTMSDVIVASNRIAARSATGEATAMGAGFQTGGAVAVRNTVIRDNHGRASGASGVAEGGGISNTLLPDGPPLGLTLTHSSVTGNSVSGGPGIAVHGGGIFSTDPVNLLGSVVAENAPDQCAGC